MNRVIWFIGYSGSGKSTLSLELNKIIENSIVLDADEIRKTINRDLGFTELDRIESNRRVLELAKLLSNNFTVIVNSILPFQKLRNNNRTYLKENYIEIWLNTPLDICVKRDVKGLYKKNTPNMTGILQRFEKPKSPNLIINTNEYSIQKSIDIIKEYLNL